MNLGGPELLIILAIILLVFGGAKLPKLARSLGEAQKEFKDGIETGASAETGETGETGAAPSTANGRVPTDTDGADDADRRSTS